MDREIGWSNPDNITELIFEYMSTLLDSVTQSRNAVYEMSCDSQVKKQVVVEGYELIDPAVLDGQYRRLINNSSAMNRLSV